MGQAGISIAHVAKLLMYVVTTPFSCLAHAAYYISSRVCTTDLCVSEEEALQNYRHDRIASITSADCTRRHGIYTFSRSLSVF